MFKKLCCSLTQACVIRLQNPTLKCLNALRTLQLLFAGEQLIGPRAYRVIFAFASLPLAILAIVYFINHRYDGTPLWDLRCVAPYKISEGSLY